MKFEQGARVICSNPRRGWAEMQNAIATVRGESPYEDCIKVEWDVPHDFPLVCYTNQFEHTGGPW